MADTPDQPIPEAVAVPKRHWTVPLVWIIPIVAALLGIWLALHYLLAQGPTITIAFKNAEGLEAGKTKVRYKDVDIGTVTDVAIADDRSQVIVTAQMAKQAERFLVQDTRFWVERPRITLGSITGLGTLFSGAYIGTDAGTSNANRRHFVGLDTPPPVLLDAKGSQFMLHAENMDSLYLGAPVYFHRVAVGKVTGYRIDPEGRGVTLDIFVDAPNDRFVTANSRFWVASGIDLSVGSGGVKLNTESLTSVVVGGISFQTPPDIADDKPAPPDTRFALYPDRDSAFKRRNRQAQEYTVYFSESLRGLAPGAAVDFHGIEIGEVRSVGLEYGAGPHAIRFPVQIALFPERLRPRGGAPQASPLERNPQDFLNRLVARGMRAQLKSGNLLTGQLFVALDFYPHAPQAKIDWTHAPPVLPSVSGSFAGIQESLASIARKLDRVPFDAIGRDLERTLQSLDGTLRSADSVLRQLDAAVLPEVRDTLAQAQQALGSAERALSSDAPVQQDLRDTLEQVNRAARALRALADYLSRHPEALIRGKE
ncbi:MlaD family protein [Ralstonia sp. RL]|uniref:PqiB family protein n=1 Tax=Ralstonia sp. RL TaxID=1839756 RepID=UPI000AE6C254|nr:MlaD family protein [Ralstonia sp. RL]